MTRGEVERIVAPYVKRIEALEKEVAELKAQPRGEQHTHYHYGGAAYTWPAISAPEPVPSTPPYWPPVICAAGTARIVGAAR